jgi:hypothetical protein
MRSKSGLMVLLGLSVALGACASKQSSHDDEYVAG